MKEGGKRERDAKQGEFVHYIMEGAKNWLALNISGEPCLVIPVRVS